MVPVELRRTLAWLGAVLAFAVLPATVLGFRDTLAHVYPSCRYTLESVDEPLPLPQRSSLDDVLPLDQDHAGLLLHLDKDVDHHGSVVSARMIRVGTDADGRVCECGRVRLHDGGVSALGGDVRRLPGGSLVYVDARWGVSSVVFRAVERPARHLQRDRLFTRFSLPALLALVAAGAFALAARRTRDAYGYLTRLHGWTESRLRPDGRVESVDGELLGTVEPAIHGLAPATLLVGPAATRGSSAYRDVPLLARDHLALGSHDAWRDTSLRALRTARRFAAFSATSAVVAMLTCYVR